MTTSTLTVAAFRRLTGATDAEMEAVLAAVTPAGRDRRIPLAEAAQALIAHVKAARQAAAGGASAAQAQAARAEADELRLALAQRDLVDADEADLVLSHLVAAVRVPFDAIPARVTRDRIQRETLRHAFTEAQAELAAGLASDD